MKATAPAATAVYATTPAKIIPALEWSATLCDGRNVDHATAEAACAALGDGWRLPTAGEMLSLVDRSCRCPAIDINAFPDTKSDWYWTSTICAWSLGCSWVVHFNGGDANGGRRDLNGACVRAVRSVAPTESATDQPIYAVRIYRAPSGQWSWEVSTEHGPECGGAGYPDAFEASNAAVAELWQHIPDPSALPDPQPYERDERDYIHTTTKGAAG